MKRVRDIALAIIAASLFLIFFLLEINKVSAAELPEIEIRKCWATAYCDFGTTASGTQTAAGRTLAAMRQDFGKTAQLYLDDGDGIIRRENFIGEYVCEDTGGEPIKKGYVVDIYIPDYDACMEFGAKRVIVLLKK